MPLFKNQILMVQFFPATGDYIVHREGQTVESYSGEGSIQDSSVSQFIRECLTEKLFHENTVHLSTGKVSGGKTLPVKQIIYCKAFDAQTDSKSGATGSNINWVLWVPTSCELTVNRGILGLAKVSRIRDLSDATDDVRAFMQACTDEHHVALSHHYNETGTGGRMKSVSEYFFSTGKIIYGFQNENVSSITEAELKGLGLLD